MSAGRILIAAAVLGSVAAAPPALAGDSAVDTTPPQLAVHQPRAGDFTRYQRPHPYFSGEVSDDVTPQPTVTITIRRNDAQPGDAPAAAEDLGPRSGWWGWNFSFGDDPPLEHGVSYDATVVATDEAGNTAAETTEFVVDGVAPRMTIAQPAGSETTDDTPTVSGTASLDDGDLPFVTAVLTRPAGQGTVGVSNVKADIASDGSWSGELSPAVAPGDYTIRFTHLDMAMNAVVVERPLRVVAPLPSDSPPPPPPAEATPPLEPFEVASTDDAALAAATRLQSAALRALRRTAIRSLLRSGTRIGVATGQAGTAMIDVLQAPRAGSRAAATRVLARGRRAVGASGRGTVAVRATAAGRRTLRGARRARLTIRVRFAPAAGRAVSLEAPLTLRR